jgi:hypothetical protein
LDLAEDVDSTEIPIKIIDDDEVELDEDFYIELFDLETKRILPGSDTKCTVTIIDDDKAGI